MRVFVTGASGYIGQAVARAFRAKGHRVHGLVRTQEDAHLLSLEEVFPLIGDLEDPETYRKVLDETDVVAHCAFDPTEKGVERDLKTIETIANAFSQAQSPKTFLYTSGVWVYGSIGDKMADESTPLNPIEMTKWRPEHEQKALQKASNHLKVVVLRPGVVFGNVGGLTNLLFISTRGGNVAIVGEGQNHWPMVHVQDLAKAYVLAAEKGVDREIFNVADDSKTTVRAIAEAIARAAKLEDKIQIISKEEGEKQFGPLVDGLLIDATVSNARIKQALGWQPNHAPFTDEADIYFNAWKTTQEVDEF